MTQDKKHMSNIAEKQAEQVPRSLRAIVRLTYDLHDFYLDLDPSRNADQNLFDILGPLAGTLQGYVKMATDDVLYHTLPEGSQEQDTTAGKEDAGV